MKIAALNTDEEITTLDHIAPLAHILSVPLYTQHENNYKYLKHYYPMTQSILLKKFKTSYFAKKFDALIACRYWNQSLKVIFENVCDKKIKLIFCPHGNSDKGHIENSIFTTYIKQDAVLVYGKHMIDNLKKYISLSNLKYAKIGNFRLLFYKKNKSFYDEVVKKEIFSKLNKNNKTILYAPTWQDLENSSSIDIILENLKNPINLNYNIIIKPHPSKLDNTKKMLKDFIKNNSNVLILDDFPLIYPLLNQCDIYLGDFSSIGYDFLYFQKPMFFLDIYQRKKSHPSLFLHNCGIQILKKDWENIFTFIKNHENKCYKKKQIKMYEYAFGKKIPVLEIRKNIAKIL